MQKYLKEVFNECAGWEDFIERIFERKYERVYKILGDDGLGPILRTFKKYQLEKDGNRSEKIQAD